MFKHAIVREPCPEMIHGLTLASLGKPEYLKALDQHNKYVEALQACGLNVQVLEAHPRFPDSTFVEDVALCTRKFAILTNPGAKSRNGEKVAMRKVLQSRFNTVEAIELPGTLDAGDVMMVGNHFYIGLSKRTNHEGASQLIRILKNNGMTGSVVPLKHMLHLKSGVSYLENNNLLVAGELTGHHAFEGFNTITVDPEEAYAANSLWVNGRILVPDGFPKTRGQIEQLGYGTIVLDVSEFRKLDGGLSCLSLRF
jgi:dimethylargininase